MGEQVQWAEGGLDWFLWRFNMHTVAGDAWNIIVGAPTIEAAQALMASYAPSDTIEGITEMGHLTLVPAAWMPAQAPRALGRYGMVMGEIPTVAAE